MQKERRLNLLGTLTKCWDGTPTVAVRKGTDPFKQMQLEADLQESETMLSLLLMMQPNVASGLFNDLTLGQGLDSRILLVAPESLAGTRIHAEGLPTAKHQCLDRFVAKTRTKIAMHDRVILDCTTDAAELIRQFSNEIEQALDPLVGEYASIPAFAGKAVAHALRLTAGLFRYCRNDAGPVDVDIVQQGISLMRFFLAERLRFASDCQASEIVMTADKIKRWIKRRTAIKDQGKRLRAGDEITPSMIQRAKLASNTGKADEAMQILVDEGVLRMGRRDRANNGRWRISYVLTRGNL